MGVEVIAVVAVVVLVAAIGYALRRSARSRVAQDAETDDRQALTTASESAGRLTVAQLAFKRRWSVERSKAALDRLTRKSLAEHRLSDTGADEYHFSSLDSYQLSDSAGGQ